MMKKSEEFAKANTASSDKITRHGYQRFYPYFLEHLRSVEGIDLLEIGFHEGNSVTLWNNYFNKPNIHAIDIKEKVSHPALTAYYKVDQSKTDELKKFANSVEKQFDFILDDGSHAPRHQWNTFIEFFPLLKEGGCYIIEDVETSFWGKSSIYGYSIDTKKFSLFKKMQVIPYIINSEFTAADLQKKFNLSDREFKALQAVELLATGHNCFMLVKKTPSLYNAYYRTSEQYPLRSNINSQRRNIFYRVTNHPKFKKLIGKKQQ